MNKNKHAMLSPSGAHRWLECTPSAYLESLEPDTPPSEFAAEGTEAHTLAEIMLSYRLGDINEVEYKTRKEQFINSSEFYDLTFEEFVSNYVKEVMMIVKDDYKDEQVKVYLEERVHFEDVVSGGSGTSDVVIIGKNFIHIIDLKFGRGVAVSAIDNPQLRLYALGALKKFRLKGPFTEARMTIIQPRLYDISTDFVSVVDLYDWAETYVRPRAELAIDGKGELIPGDHCRFCKRRAKCEALANMQLQAAQKEFELVVVENNILEPHNMTPEMLSKIMAIGPKFTEWFNEVYKYATAAMINEGIEIPGYKVVEGRSQRVIINPEAIAEKLRTSGFKPQSYLKPVDLLGITALEKNIGKKLFNDLCGEFIIKPPGKLTVVPETDNRIALKTKRLSGQEFDIIDENK